MDWIQKRQITARNATFGMLLAATCWLSMTGTATAQFECPPLEGAAAGVGAPATTVEISILGDEGVLGGEAPIRAEMAESQENVAGVFFDICFDVTKLSLDQELQSTGSPCDAKEDCPGAQACGDDGTCQAFIVTACSLAGNLGDNHRLVASSPEIPENPDNPERLRLFVLDKSADAADCETAEDCGENQICPFGKCITTCTGNENCPAGNRCKELNDGSEQMVCSPLNIIPNGPLVNCTFDVAENPDIAGSTPLTFGLLQVSDDSIPSSLAIPAIGIPGSINLVPCQNDEDCPDGKVCSDDGVCRAPTPTPTLTPTGTGPTITPTPTVTTPVPLVTNTPTRTVTSGTNTPTRTNTSGTATVTPTLTSTATGGTRTPTRTATATPTGDGGGGGGGCDCAIQPAHDAGWMRTLMPLLIPAAMLWGRRRRL